jgi:hypothetical protein
MCFSVVVALLSPMLSPWAAGDDEAVPGPEPQFRERAVAFFRPGPERVPLAVTTTCGAPEKNYILEVNGGGVVLEDFDVDGHIDLVVIDGSTLERVASGRPGLPPRLFLNAGDGTFDLAGGDWEMSGGRWGMGGAAGDVDGDGAPDLVVTEWGTDRLFLGRGGRGLEESAESGLSGERWGTSAALLDYDLDGALDLVVVNYLAFRPAEIQSRTDGACRWKGNAVMCGPEGLTPVHDQLYRGGGDGTFEDATRVAGFRPRDAGFGLGVMTLDHDMDGDTDVYVTNDSTPNHLWVNGADGTFSEQGLELDVALDPSGKEQAGMGIACGDLDEDGYPDLFVTNFSGEPNTLYGSTRRSGVPRFRDRTNRLGLGGPSLVYLGWGTGMADFDLDGDRDLYVLNGHVYPQADAPGTDTTYAQPDHFYRNPGGGQLVQEPLSDAVPFVSRAGASADLDGDGDLDLVVLEVDGRVRVFENRGGTGHWLAVRLVDRTRNRAALGAIVTARHGKRVWTEEVRTSGGFQTSVPAVAWFGLGSVDRIERLTVRWPDGEEQALEDVAVDRPLQIVRPAEEGTVR